MDIKDIKKAKNIYTGKLQAMNNQKGVFNSIRNIPEKARIKKQIQALTEAERDVTTTYVTNTQSTTEVVDKNNYKKYNQQVKFCYEAYSGDIDYGAELLRGIIQTKVAFVAGEGLSIFAAKKSTQKFIDDFLEYNKLHGSRLLRMVEIGELEGRNLMVLKQDPKNRKIKARSFSWYINKYTVDCDGIDTDEITQIYYKKNKDEDKLSYIPVDKSVYIRLGGTDYDLNETSTDLHCVLTDIENYSRAKYDLRKNNHLFAKLTPYFKTETQEQANSINNALPDWQIGQGYAGSADFSLVGPGTGALEALKGEMLLALKNISSTVSEPIHWLGWPELMSNRATAENLLEVVNAGTKKRRLLWEEGIKELIEKAMVFAIDSGYEDSSIRGDFQVKLPLVSLANLKMIAEIWMPLMDSGVISMSTLRNKLPEINPSEEKKLVDKEKKENMDRMQESMINNGNDKEDENGDDDDETGGINE